GVGGFDAPEGERVRGQSGGRLGRGRVGGGAGRPPAIARHTSRTPARGGLRSRGRIEREAGCPAGIGDTAFPASKQPGRLAAPKSASRVVVGSMVVKKSQPLRKARRLLRLRPTSEVPAPRSPIFGIREFAPGCVARANPS